MNKTITTEQIKAITTEQIKAILDTFFQLNAPVQVYSGVQKLLSELPDAAEETPKKK